MKEVWQGNPLDLLVGFKISKIGKAVLYNAYENYVKNMLDNNDTKLQSFTEYFPSDGEGYYIIPYKQFCATFEDNLHDMYFENYNISIYESSIHQVHSKEPEPKSQPNIAGDSLVGVKLTDYGKNKYLQDVKAEAAKLGMELLSFELPPEDEEGYSIFRLGEFIRIFGRELNGSSEGSPAILSSRELKLK